MNKKGKLIFIFVQCYLLVVLYSCLTFDEDINVVDWLEGRKMEAGQTYGDSRKIFRVWDTLTIPPNVTILGTKIEFQEKTIVQEGVTLDCNDGELKVLKQIVVTGSIDNPVTVNGWTHLDKNVITGNSFDYTVLNGGLVLDASVIPKAISLRNCTIMNGTTSGVILRDSTLVEMANCTFQDNIPFDIETQSGNIELIDSTNTFDKGICFTSFCGISKDLVLPTTTYFCKEGMGAYGALTIKEGTNVNFESDYGFTIALGGSVNILGTQEAPVTFTGGKYFLRFLADSNSVTPTNKVTYTNFLDNSLTRWSDIFYYIKAGIFVMDSNLEMENCMIRDYDLWAIHLSKEATLKLTNCSGFDSTHLYIAERTRDFD